jgi:hypothetical protein
MAAIFFDLVDVNAVAERSRTVSHDSVHAAEATRRELGAIFASVELSKKTWLLTSMSPGTGQKMSRRIIAGGDISGLFAQLTMLWRGAHDRPGSDYPFVIIQEAGLDGFWVHRALMAEGYESHVVDTASMATSRRKRRVKTDRLDGESLIRALLAFKRGEPRVCSMLHVPTPDEEDRRRIVRERKVLMEERIRHSNRIKGLLFSQGITGYAPLQRDRREQLETLRTGDGRDLRLHMKRRVLRELTRMELLIGQIRKLRQNVTTCVRRNSSQLAKWHYCRRSSASGQSLLSSSGVRACFDASTSGGRSPRTRGRHQRLGRVDPSPGAFGFDQPCWRWPGFG